MTSRRTEAKRGRTGAPASPWRGTPNEFDAQRGLRPAAPSVQTPCGMTVRSSTRQRPLHLLDPTATPPAPSVHRMLAGSPSPPGCSCYPNKREAKFLFRSKGNEMRPPASGYMCPLVSMMITSVRLHSLPRRSLFLSSSFELNKSECEETGNQRNGLIIPES